MNLNLRVRWLTAPPTFLTLWVRRAGGVGASMSSCTTFSSMECRRGCTAWRRTVDESAETVLRDRRILELAAEGDEANSVVFPGGVLHEDNASVPESSSPPLQWPWAASGEINMWNPLLSAVADVFSGPVLDDMVSEVDMGRLALTCHFSLDVLCMEMHQPHDFLTAGALFGFADPCQ